MMLCVFAVLSVGLTYVIGHELGKVSTQDHKDHIVYVAQYGEDRPGCGRSELTPCCTIRQALAQLPAPGTVMLDATGSEQHPEWLCDSQPLVLNASMSLIGWNGRAVIGCDIRRGRLLEVRLESGDGRADVTEQPSTPAITLHFEAVHFSSVVFHGAVANTSVHLTFNDVHLSDSSFQYLAINGSRFKLNLRDSRWLGSTEQNCSEKCGSTATVNVTVDNLRWRMHNTSFYHTKLVVSALDDGDVLIDGCSFLARPHALKPNHGELYISVAHHRPNDITVQNCRFENHVYPDPIQSISNLYRAALMLRGRALPGVKTGEPTAHVINCTFSHNERGLTFLGNFNTTYTENCTFNNNIAMHAGGGILYLTSMLTRSYVRDCDFRNNEAGAYRPGSIAGYESSFRIEGNEVRIQSNCCKGLISFVGKGGAIRVQRGLLAMTNCSFANNTARLLGGAIFIDRECKLDMDGAYFENSAIGHHSVQGDVFYSNGGITIKGAQIIALSATNHVSLLQHSGNHWSIEVSDILIRCPVGYGLRVANTSAYGVSTDGLRRSYKLDQLSYNCESCPRHKYSLDYGFLNFSLVYSSFAYYTLLINGSAPSSPFSGTYHYQDIECRTCPYGGRCEQGITAVANFWGYIDESEGEARREVKFQHCPKGYCCTRKLCSAFDTCARNRQGRLCGSCAPGYSEALFSPQCIRDDDCDATLLWPLALFTGVSYALFLLFQKDIRDLMFTNTVNLRDIPLPWRERRSRRSSRRKGCNSIPLQLHRNTMALPLKDEIEVEASTTESSQHHTKGYVRPFNDQNGGLRKRGYVNNVDQSEPCSADEEEAEEAPADTGASFLIILFYYFQDAQLLHIKTVFETEENKTREIFREILSGLFKFRIEIFSFMDNVCFLSGITPTSKLLIKVILVPFVLVFFGVMYCFYRVTLCFKQSKDDVTKMKQINGVTIAAYHQQANGSKRASDSHKSTTAEPGKAFVRRLATGFVLALLFTYQKLATTCFTLLNCVPVSNESVLFIEGTITCYNKLQYMVMIYTVVCIVPFFLVLLIGPGLLRHGYIHLPQFFCACLVPFPFLVYWTWLRVRHRGLGPEVTPEHSEEAVSVMAILQGPFKDNIHAVFGPMCGAGLLLGRRLVLIILFTFVNDSLPRMLGMISLCFIVLLHHAHTLPYKDTRGNMAGSASASGLLLVGAINLVRACFEGAEYDPQGPNKTLMNVFHELELLLMLWIPALVMGVAILLMLLRILLLCWERCCERS